MAKQEAAQVPLLDAELRSSQLFGVAAALVSTLALALYIRLYSVYLWGGYYINEFDPYIRYYLTQFMLSLGSVKGIEWWLSGGFINGHPYKFTNFWYPPWGINWAIVLSPGVSFTGLLSYDLLKHFHVSLLYTVIMVPGVINALSVLSMYYLGSRIGGEVRGGLLSAVLTAYSIIFTQRGGSAGWFADSTLFQFVVPPRLWAIHRRVEEEGLDTVRSAGRRRQRRHGVALGGLLHVHNERLWLVHDSHVDIWNIQGV